MNLNFVVMSNLFFKPHPAIVCTGLAEKMVGCDPYGPLISWVDMLRRFCFG